MCVRRERERERERDRDRERERESERRGWGFGHLLGYLCVENISFSVCGLIKLAKRTFHSRYIPTSITGYGGGGGEQNGEPMHIVASMIKPCMFAFQNTEIVLFCFLSLLSC